jgi:hypothetical protein
MRFNLPFQDKPFDVVGMGLNSVDFLAVVPQQAVAQTDFLLRQARHDRKCYMISTYYRSPLSLSKSERRSTAQSQNDGGNIFQP